MPWTAVVPVKGLGSAKSRLADVLTPRERADLVLAMAADVLSAAAAADSVQRVVVVTPDADAARRLGGRGVEVLAEERATTLNGAFRLAIATLPGRLALLTADLPLLLGPDLDGALSRVPAFTAGVVADAEGTGTTLLAARHGRLLEPRFGPNSHWRHRLAGATDLTADAGEGLRHDVDTEPALTAVRGHPRLGPATGAWIGAHLRGAA